MNLTISFIGETLYLLSWTAIRTRLTLNNMHVVIIAVLSIVKKKKFCQLSY